MTKFALGDLVSLHPWRFKKLSAGERAQFISPIGIVRDTRAVGEELQYFVEGFTKKKTLWFESSLQKASTSHPISLGDYL